jgi:hypothetical protein
MRVDEVIRLLQRETPDEEVVIILNDDRTKYYRLEYRPFLHAGPAPFIDEAGNPQSKSVVMIPVVMPKGD